MGEVLVLVDHVDGDVRKQAAELLTLARRLGDPAAVFVGPGQSVAQPKLAEYGASKIYLLEQPELTEYVVGPKAEALAQLVTRTNPAAVVLPSGPEGKEIAARLALKVESGLITDVIDIDAEGVATQAVFAGNHTVRSRVTHGTPIFTVKPNATTPEPAPASPTVEQVEVEISERAKGAKVIDSKPREQTGRPDLAEASTVVSGGRGVGSAENFTVVEQLADALGGAVGASRAAVDAGWYPHAYQVGQTGTTVAPQLYVAAGISGAIQHRAGMQTSQTIVVINKDSEAPIFELADFGVVGDLHKVVPQAVEELQSRSS